MPELKFDEQKATEAGTLLLSLKGGRSDYWWIIKMLYLVDREALQRWERPVTYDTYELLPYGPVLMNIYNIISKNLPSPFWRKYIVTLSKRSEVMLNGSPAPIKKLSLAEVELIKEMFEKYGKDHTGAELVDFTHNLPEWHDPNGKTLPLSLSELLNVLEYKPEDIERIQVELREEESLDALFGG